MEIFGFIYAAVKAIPALRDMVNTFILKWTEKELAAQRAEIIAGLDKLFEQRNQIDLEKAIGSDNAGKPSTDQSGVERVRPGDLE